MTYKVQSKFLVPNEHPNRCGIKLTNILGLVIHWTANTSNGADDIANVRYFGRQYEKDNGRWEEINTNDPFRYGSAHYIVDQDSIQLSIPEDEVAYHVGAKTYTNFAKQKFTQNGICKPNYFTIGIEMCVNKDNNWEKTVELTAELASDIMLRYKLNIDQIIRHYDITGKICPKPYVDNPKAWSDFKALVAKKIKQKTIAEVINLFKDSNKVSAFAKSSVEKLEKIGLIKGDNNGNFNPKNPINREEFAVVIDRLIKYLGK